MTKNYLNKKVENVTAPREWQSGPDSPPTKLAYVTQPEIDLLVKANIHGSMKGKPNKGPKGIMSLDGGGIDEAYSEKVSDKSFGQQMGVTLDMSKPKDREKRQKFLTGLVQCSVSGKQKTHTVDLYMVMVLVLKFILKAIQMNVIGYGILEA